MASTSEVASSEAATASGNHQGQGNGSSFPVRAFTVPGPQAMLHTSKFSVPEAWEPVRFLGSGGYAVVAAFWLASEGELCAVKKIANVLDDPVLALRTLREVRLLSHFNHSNVLSLREVFMDGPKFRDVYLRLEIMDGDLGQLINTTKDGMTDYQVQCVVYQIMRGLLCLRMARVIHRDLKPGNILVRADGAVKIADFGLARGIDQSVLTEYVVTRWYRAPEVVLAAARYTYAVDMWSLGCIFAEMLTRKPLFEGKDSLDQVKKIVSVLGMPCEEDLRWLPESSASRKFVNRCDQSGSDGTLHQMLQRYGANPIAIELISEMLNFDPSKRIPVDHGLHHRYLEFFGAQGDPEVAAARAVQPLDWAFDSEIRCGHDLVDRAEPPSSPSSSYDPQRFRDALFQARAFAVPTATSSGQATLLPTTRKKEVITSSETVTPSRVDQITKGDDKQYKVAVSSDGSDQVVSRPKKNPTVVAPMPVTRGYAVDSLDKKDRVGSSTCSKETEPRTRACIESPMLSQVTSPALAYLRRIRSMSCADARANVRKSRGATTVLQQPSGAPVNSMASPLDTARRTTNEAGLRHSSESSSIGRPHRACDSPRMKTRCTQNLSVGVAELPGSETSQDSIPRLATMRRYRSLSCPSTRTPVLSTSTSSMASKQNSTDHSDPTDCISATSSPRPSPGIITAAPTALAHAAPSSAVVNRCRRAFTPASAKSACIGRRCSPPICDSPPCATAVVRVASTRCPSRRRRSMSCPKPCTNLLISHSSSLSMRESSVDNLRSAKPGGNIATSPMLLHAQPTPAISPVGPGTPAASGRRSRRPRARRESRTGPRGELWSNARRPS